MMVQIDQSASSLLGRAPGVLSMRICGGSLNGQVVRLQSSKCTVGSDPQCTLRLRARGIDSLHCLILRGARGTIVRRFATGTRLNGASFIDAPLRTGDRLGLGPIELRVLDDGRSEKDFSTETNVAKTNQREQEDSKHEQYEQAIERLRSQKEQACRRTHRLIEELRSAREQVADLEAHHAGAELQRKQDAAFLKQHEQDRAIERTELACRLEELSRELQQNASSKQAIEQKLAVLQAEFETAQQIGQQEAEQWAEEKSEHLSQLQRRETELAELRSELDESRRSWDEDRQAWETKLADEQSTAMREQRDAWESERRAQLLITESLEKELQQTVAQLESVEAQRDEAVAESERLSTQSEHAHSEYLEGERQRWEAEQAAADTLLTQAQAELDEQHERWESERQQHAERIASLEAQLKKAAEQRDEAIAETQQAAAQTEQHYREIQENDSLKKEAERQEYAEQVAQLESQLNELTRQLDQTIAERDEAVAQAQHTELEAEQESRQLLESERQNWEAEQTAAEAQLKQAKTELDSQRAAWQQEREQWQAECDAEQALLREGLDALKEERATFEQQRTEWNDNHQTQSDQAANSMQSVAAEAEALNEERQRFETECQESRLLLEQQREALEQQQQAWEEERRLWNETQAEQEQQIRQAHSELELQRRDLEQDQASLDLQSTSKVEPVEDSRFQHNTPQSLPSSVDNVPEVESESQFTDWYRQQEQVQQQRMLDSDEGLSDSSAADSTELVSESLQVDAHEDENSTLGSSSSLWDDQSADQEGVSIPQTTAEITFEPVAEDSSPIPTTLPPEGAEEESIEDYMAKLLQRVQGNSGATASQPVTPGLNENPDNAAVLTEAVPVTEIDHGASGNGQSEALRKRVEPFVMQPRNLPPELTSSLAAMRQLANSSARKAIDRSVQQRWFNAAVGKLTVGSAGLIGGVILLFWAPDYSGVTFFGSMLAFLIAVFWMLQSAIIFRNLLTTPRVEDEDHDEQDSSGSQSMLEAPTPAQEPGAEATVEQVDTEAETGEVEDSEVAQISDDADDEQPTDSAETDESVQS